MASNSPIVLNSSASTARRLPSTTPSRSRSDNSSSPPGLPSPSTFVRSFPLAKSTTGLKTGSRSQAAPARAFLGFTTAASLPRTALETETDVPEVVPKAKGKEKRENSDLATRKKPAKLPKMEKAKESADLLDKNPLQEVCYHEDAGKDGKSGSTGDIVETETAPVSLENGTHSRKLRIDLSEYDVHLAEKPFRPSEVVKNANKPRKLDARSKDAAMKVSVTKPRKRASNQKDTAESAQAKKPRKRLAKSESLILNSDEPDSTQVTGIPTAQRMKAGTDHQRSRTGFATEDVEKTSKHFHEVSVDGSAVSSSPPLDSSGNALQQSVYFASTDARPAIPEPASRAYETESTDSHLPAEKPVAHFSTRCWESATDLPAPEIPLAELEDAFSYTETNLPSKSPERLMTGEATTKRRPVDLADARSLVVTLNGYPDASPADAMKKADATPAEHSKKTRAPKRKPQTITALATKAYLAPELERSVFEFSSPRVQKEKPSLALAKDRSVPALAEPVIATKPTKPRKTRTKKTDDVPTTVKLTKPAKTAKPKPAKATKLKKVKVNETALLTRLYTPEAARAEEHSQGFMFGTSSQLAVEESPSFIREIQIAMHDSEDLSMSQVAVSPKRKNCSRGSSAPHGTNLSVGRAERDLWCTAARNYDGDVFEIELGRLSAEPSRTTRTAVSEPLKIIQEQNDPPNSCFSKQSVPPALAIDETGPCLSQERIDIDLSCTAPFAPDDPFVDHRNKAEVRHLSVTSTTSDEATQAQRTTYSMSDDNWMLLSSDESPVDDDKKNKAQSPSPSPSPDPKPPITSLGRSATSPLRLRPALQNLDANASIVVQASPIKTKDYMQERSISTVATTITSKRPRGRPRKVSSTSAVTKPASPNPRGRPSKNATKTPCVPDQIINKVTTQTSLPASRPAESSRWVNVDEISDSESAVTPSPPRRRANSSPSVVRPLDLGIMPPSSVKPKAASVATTVMKVVDERWSAIAVRLFPQITNTIRCTLPSTDLSSPTWHEKILLYDPIEPEDLTAWLNEQGLRIETQRLKPKEKKKGRKKKDAEEEAPEFEDVREELKPWMVQKWCEEKSVCCVPTESWNNGGRRNRH